MKISELIENLDLDPRTGLKEVLLALAGDRDVPAEPEPDKGE